jgi:hypothetical protein
MPIILDAKLIEKLPPRLANFLVSPLSLGPKKKQNSVALSTIEAEYVVAGSCYAQLL